VARKASPGRAARSGAGGTASEEAQAKVNRSAQCSRVAALSRMNLVWNTEHKVPAEPLSMLSSSEEVFVWLNAHCRANARQPLARALIVLFFELVKRKEGR
jgi:hypothetical protein